jgi:hypothetical protein
MRSAYRATCLACDVPASVKGLSKLRKAVTVIVDVVARKIVDSRGNPTVEVDVSEDDAAGQEHLRWERVAGVGDGLYPPTLPLDGETDS